MDVVAFGDVNVDILAHFAQYPPRGEDSFALSTEFRCGGSAANTACALCQMGLRASLIGRVGSDPWGSMAVDILRRAGVTLTGLQVDPGLITGLVYAVVTPDAERTMLTTRGANVRADPAQIHHEEICDARLLHLSGYALLAEPQRSAARRALDLARNAGLTISLDPGLGPAELPEMRTILPQLDILLPTLAEARLLTGRGDDAQRCADALLEAGVGAVAIKLGKGGCLAGSRDRLVLVPAFPVEAWDSTGAGDYFDAGILVARLGGLDWHSAAVLGNALGALAATRVGGQAEALQPQKVGSLLQAHRGSHRFREHRKAMDEAIEFLG